MAARTNTAPNSTGVSKSPLAIRINWPIPSDPDRNSATTAPISDNGTEIRSPANTNGREEGTRNRQKICHVDALIVLRKSCARGSTLRNPTTEFTSIGKNVIMAAINTFGASPNPNHIVNRGATATIGVTFSASAGTDLYDSF